MALLLVAVGIAAIAAYSGQATTSAKPIILYVNQGNGVVNQTNYAAMLAFAKTHGFNTIFFQVFRSGQLLFSADQLQSFVAEAHSQQLKIFFALYFTNSTQQLPVSVYGLQQDGISLDMSVLPTASQASLLGSLQGAYHGGKVAVTATDFATPLRPDMLILETYGSSSQGVIRHGIIASVGVFATTSGQDYKQQYQYALNNSDGVMVFDYSGLLKSGY